MLASFKHQEMNILLSHQYIIEYIMHVLLSNKHYKYIIVHNEALLLQLYIQLNCIKKVVECIKMFTHFHFFASTATGCRTQNLSSSIIHSSFWIRKFGNRLEIGLGNNCVTLKGLTLSHFKIVESVYGIK